MEQKTIIQLETSELESLVSKAVQTARQADETAKNVPTVVYGIRGICDLFKVSHATAQRYKNTFLAPAVSQRGRKIMVNVAEAVRLFNENI